MWDSKEPKLVPSCDYGRRISSVNSKLGKRNFDRLKSPRKRIKYLDPRVPLQLRINHRVSLIWVQNCLARNEMAYDEHDASFEKVVCNAEEWIRVDQKLRQEDNDSNLDKFTLEAGIIPMLYWSATKCRHPVLRRKAIQALYACPVKEGLWNTARLGKVAEMIMSVEEAGLESLPFEQRIPDVKDRVYEAIMRGAFETCPSNRVYVKLWFKPSGSDGPWDSRVTYVYWSSA